MYKGKFRKYVVTWHDIYETCNLDEQHVYIEVMGDCLWCEYTVGTLGESVEEQALTNILMQKFGFDIGDVVFLLI